MITEIVHKYHVSGNSPFPDPNQYRYWSDFVQRMKADGHLLDSKIEEYSDLYKRIVNEWKNWDSYMIQFFDVGARPIVDLMERHELENGITTEVVLIES